FPTVESWVVMGSVQRPRRALCGPEQVHPPDRAVKGDGNTGVDRPLWLGPADDAEIEPHSPFRGFCAFVPGRVDENHVPDDYTQGFESERCKHRIPFLVPDRA